MDLSKKSGVGARLMVIAALAAWGAAWLAPTQTSKAQNSPPIAPQPAGVERPIAEGRQIFDERCAGCHGLDGRGGERAPDIATRAAVQQETDAKLYEIIKAGNPTAGMPAFPSLDEGSTRALIAYVRFLQGKGPSTAIPGNPRNGAALFSGKGRCSECHLLVGKGGFIASDLSAFGRGRSATEIREAITAPRQDARANSLLLVTTRNGGKFMGVVRNEDNFSLQLQSLDGVFHLLAKPEIESIVRQPDPLMPSNYGTTLTTQELDDLIGFLMTVAQREHTPAPKKEFREDEENE
jgi:cytochrome c oxidase cbb3-type subunit III